MHHTAPSVPRRFFVAVAVTFAALLALALTTAAKDANSQTPPTAAVNATRAFSTFHDADISMPNSLATFATLNISASGSYVINAKLDARNRSGADSTSDQCVLRAGGDFDTLNFDVDGASEDDDEAVALQVVHTFTSPGAVTLSCTDRGAGDVVAQFTKITAVQVAQLSNVPF